MRITVIGCGRWGSFIAWYLDGLRHQVTLYGRENSAKMQRFLAERKNDLLTLPESVALTTDIRCVEDADILVISVNAQGLRALCEELKPFSLKSKTFVLCMKGLEIGTGKRLSQIVTESVDPSNRVAVWLGPGHVQEFCSRVPNCMVIDSDDEMVKYDLVAAFSGDLIRFYYGTDLIGNEIGAASKNVIGIAAGILDGMNLPTLKGPLITRGPLEISQLITALGGKGISAYGLCHLGDYEATVFSPYSHNRKFGEAFVNGEKYSQLAEGYYTAQALMDMSVKYGVELPICSAVYDVLYHGTDATAALNALLSRRQVEEF